MKYTARALAFVFCLFLLSQARGMELSDLSIEYNEAIGTNRNRLLPKDTTKKGELNLNMAVRSSKYTYTDLQIESVIDSHQFRTVGLEIESGVRYKQIELYLQHHSQHVLDRADTEKYPNENGIGLRMKLCCK